MGRKRKKGRINRYIAREQAGGAAPEKKANQKAGDEFVTQNDLATALTPIANQVNTVAQSVSALHESFKGSPKTDAQGQEMTERQLADAQNINRKKAPTKVFGAPTLGADALFKDVTPGMSRKDARDKIQEVISSETDNATIKEFHHRIDRIKLQCHLSGKLPFQLEAYDEYVDWLEKTGIDKVLNIAGSPANYIPEGWSMETLQYYYQALRVVSAFDEFPMAHRMETFPIIGRPEAQHQTARGPKRGDETDEFSATDPDQGVTTFTARTLHVRVNLEDEYIEDSANVLETLLRLIPNAMAKGMESLVINGSRTATHEDNRFHTKTNAIEKAFDGMRRIAGERGTEAMLNIETDSGTFGFDDFSRLLEKGSQEYHVMPDECCWILPNAVYTKCMRFSQLETWDKNPLPTNINGVVGWILGRPVVVSGEYPQDLNTAGYNSATPTDNTKTGFLHFNKMQFMVGNRRQETVVQLNDELTGYYYIISKTRRDFQSMENRRAGYTPALVAHNITTAS